MGSNPNYQLFIPVTLFPTTQTAAAILYAVSLLLQGAFCLSMVNSSSKSTSTSLKIEFARSPIAEAFTWSIIELIGN
jgi:hypothetical protein